MTSGKKKVTTLAKPRKAKRRRIRIRLVVQNPVENPAVVPNDAEEQTGVHVKTEKDYIRVSDKKI